MLGSPEGRSGRDGQFGTFGYYLHRKLESMGVNNLVVQPQDWDERGKGVKTDRIDALALCQRLDRYVRGNRKAFSVLRVLSEEEERERAISRQRGQLVRERQRLQAMGRSGGTAVGAGDPVTGGADAALVAGGAEVAALAGEGEEAFVAAIRALEAGEAGGEVATAEKGLDGGDGGRRERAEGFTVVFLVVGEEVVPAVVLSLWVGNRSHRALLE